MPNLTWEEIRDIIHDIKDERVVVCGAVLRLQETDQKLQRVERHLEDIVIQHEFENE